MSIFQLRWFVLNTRPTWEDSCCVLSSWAWPTKIMSTSCPISCATTTAARCGSTWTQAMLTAATWRPRQPSSRAWWYIHTHMCLEDVLSISPPHVENAIIFKKLGFYRLRCQRQATMSYIISKKRSYRRPKDLRSSSRVIRLRITTYVKSFFVHVIDGIVCINLRDLCIAHFFTMQFTCTHLRWIKPCVKVAVWKIPIGFWTTQKIYSF